METLPEPKKNKKRRKPKTENSILPDFEKVPTNISIENRFRTILDELESVGLKKSYIINKVLEDNVPYLLALLREKNKTSKIIFP